MSILFNFVIFGVHGNFQGCTIFVMIEKESSFTWLVPFVLQKINHNFIVVTVVVYRYLSKIPCD